MRILAVTNMYPTVHAPGLGTFVEQQILSLREIGLAVEVLFVDRVKDGMPVYGQLLPRARAMIRQFQPDLVHVMYGGVMSDLVTKYINDRPVVITFHGTDLLGEKLSGFLRNSMARYGVWASWRAARRACGIVVVWKGLQRALPPGLNKPIKIIPCGIDLERFKPLNRDDCLNELGWNRDHFHILFPSNSGNPVKRPTLAQAAVQALNGLGVNAEIHFLRGVRNMEVPIWINASDVLLLTSLHEASPMVVKESLACNVPIVSVDVGDVREQIQGIEGCYLALSDPEDLARKLKMVFAGTRRVEARLKLQQLSLERVALRLKEFYGEVLAVSSQQRASKFAPCSQSFTRRPNDNAGDAA